MSSTVSSKSCAQCGVDGAKKRCSRCKKVVYCTRDCQAKHWRAEHKAVCGKQSNPAAKAAKNTAAARTAATTASPLSSMSTAEFFEDSCVPVKLGASSTHGRSLLAKAALPPGVLVLAADRYAAVPTADAVTSRCFNCFDTCTTMQRCSKCKVAIFCSKECMLHAASRHLIQCAALKRLQGATMAFEGDKECFQFLASSLGPSASYAEAAAAEAQGSRTSAWLQNDKESLRLALAMLARRHSEQGKADAASPGKASRGVRHPWCYADVAELESHQAELQRGQWEGVLGGARFLLAQCAGTPLEACATPEEVAGLLLRIKFNAHPVIDTEASNIRVGLGVYPAGCYMNHSCRPNSVVHTINGGNILVVRSLRPIAAGEQVTCAYIDLYQSTLERQRLLKSGFLFDCTCDRCSAPPTAAPNCYIDAFMCAPTCTAANISGAAAGCKGFLRRTSASADVLECSTCKVAVPASTCEAMTSRIMAQFQQAMQLSQDDALAAFRCFEALRATTEARCLHRFHKIAFSLHLLSIVTATRLAASSTSDGGDSKQAQRAREARVVHLAAALRALQAVCPEQVTHMADLASMYLAAQVSGLRRAGALPPGVGSGGGSGSGAGGGAGAGVAASAGGAKDGAAPTTNITGISLREAQVAAGNALHVLTLAFGPDHPRSQSASQLAQRLRVGFGPQAAQKGVGVWQGAGGKS